VFLGRDPFVETGFGFESETGFSFGMYVKQTVSIQPVSILHSNIYHCMK